GEPVGSLEASEIRISIVKASAKASVNPEVKTGAKGQTLLAVFFEQIPISAPEGDQITEGVLSTYVNVLAVVIGVGSIGYDSEPMVSGVERVPAEADPEEERQVEFVRQEL